MIFVNLFSLTLQEIGGYAVHFWPHIGTKLVHFLRPFNKEAAKGVDTKQQLVLVLMVPIMGMVVVMTTD